MSCFSGIVDDHDAIHPGPYPGALRDVLGMIVEEFTPLRAGEQVRLGDGLTGQAWSEIVTLRGAETVWSYVDGPAAGGPAVTRHTTGRGKAWYVSTLLGAESLDAVLREAASDARLPPRDLPRDVEVVERVGTEGRYLFVINHTGEDAMVPVGERAAELITGQPHSGDACVPAGEVRVFAVPPR